MGALSITTVETVSSVFCAKTIFNTPRKIIIAQNIAFNFKNDDKTNKLVKHHLLRKDFEKK